MAGVIWYPAHSKTRATSGTGIIRRDMGYGNMPKSWKQQFKSMLYGIVLGLMIPTLALGQAALLPNAKQQYLDDSGNPVALGQVQYYIPGTSTKKTVYLDAAATTPSTNPVLLDAAGRPQPTGQTFGTGSYRQKVVDANNLTVWDAVTSSTGSGGGGGGTVSTIGDGANVGTVAIWSGANDLPINYLWTYGQAVSRATYPTLFTVLTITQSTAVCSSGSTTLSGLTDTTRIGIGSAIEGICITPGTTVISKTVNSVVMSGVATGSFTTPIVFFPWGNGNGSTTFNLPALNGKYPVGRCNMGGATCALLQTYYGADPNGMGVAGGNQSKTLVAAENGPHFHSVFFNDASHTHGLTTLNSNRSLAAGGGGSGFAGGADNPNFVGAAITVNSSVTGASISSVLGAGTANQTASSGSGTAFSLIPPSSTVDYIIKALPDAQGKVNVIVLSASRLATTAALPSNTYNNGTSGVGATLTATGNGALSVDSVAVAASNQILVKNETTMANNGIYTVVQPGTGGTPYILQRLAAFDASTEMVVGSYTLVTAGTVNAGTSWVLQNSVSVVGTDPVIFNEFTTPAPFPVQTANTFFAGPASGAAATPTFRVQVTADMPLFLQSGTLAITRTYLGKVGEIYSASDYCSDTTGTVDCTAKLQNALDTVPYGKALYLPYPYLISSTLTRNTPIEIYGNTQTGAGIIMSSGFPTTSDTISITPAASTTGWRIHDFQISGQGGARGRHGIAFNTGTVPGATAYDVDVRRMLIQATATGQSIKVNNTDTSGGVFTSAFDNNNLESIHFDLIGDTISIRNNAIASQLATGNPSIYYSQVTGAGNMQIVGNNGSGLNGIVIADSGVAPVLRDNEFESLAGVNVYGCMVDMRGTTAEISAPQLLNNQIQIVAGTVGAPLVPVCFGVTTRASIKGGRLARPTAGNHIVNGASAVTTVIGADITPYIGAVAQAIPTVLETAAPLYEQLATSALGNSGAIPYYNPSGRLVSTASLSTGQVILATTGGAPTGSNVGTDGQLMLARTGNYPLFNTMSQDCTITNAGVMTCLKTNNVSFGALATVTPGTGVATAAAANVGTAGSFVVNGGALGTPSSGVATNFTGTATALNIGGNAATATTATSATTAGNATNTGITDDTTTNATMFPTWVTANTGNLPQKVTSTKLSFNPSTGTLNSTLVNVGGSTVTGDSVSIHTGGLASVGFLQTAVAQWSMGMPSGSGTFYITASGLPNAGTNAIVITTAGAVTYPASIAATALNTGTLIIQNGGMSVGGALYGGAEIVTGVTTVGSLPTCNAGRKGARHFVTDELAAVAFNTVATGGGANNVPVFCDGTNWRIG